MNDRDWLTLALRTLGFWVLISAVGSTASLVLAVWGFDQRFRGDYILGTGLPVVAYSLLSAGLLLFASSIAGWFEAGKAHRELAPAGRIELVDVYQVVARALGVFCVISAIRPASLFAWQLLQRGSSSSSPEGLNWGIAIEALAYLGVAASLILRADAIARVSLNSHRRDATAPGHHPLDG